MSKILLVLCCAVSVGISLASPVLNKTENLPEWAEQIGSHPAWARDRIVLRIRESYTEDCRSSIVALRHYPALQIIAEERHVRSSRSLLGAQGSGAIAHKSGLSRDLIIELAENSDLLKEMELWSRQPEVEWVEPDWMCSILEIPNDPDWDSQWALRNIGQAPGNGLPDCDINADDAWDLSTGQSWITIAILDTGIDLDHPDLQAKIVPGQDLINNDSYADDDHSHGTACASLAAASTDNETGMSGVDWQARLMPVKVLDASGQGTSSTIAAGVYWAVNHGADVISMSLGGGGFSTSFDNAITAAHDMGTVVVSAAGNDNFSVVSYPSRYTNSFSVGALSPCFTRKTPDSCDGEWWWGSNYGTHLDLLAPGVKLRAAVIDGYINTMNGTSGATPHVAGVAALVKSLNPGLSADAVFDILRNSAEDMGPAGFDVETGYGRLNAFAALQLVPAPTPCEFDQTPPLILHAALSNTAQTLEPYLVECNISDNCAILTTVLRWSVNGGTWFESGLTAVGNDNYEAQIPAQILGSQIDYQIHAVDASSFFNEAFVAHSFLITSDLPLLVPVLEIALVGSNQIHLSWNSIAGAADYEVLRSISGGPYISFQSLAGTELNFVIGGEVRQQFKVVARN